MESFAASLFRLILSIPGPIGASRNPRMPFQSRWWEYEKEPKQVVLVDEQIRLVYPFIMVWFSYNLASRSFTLPRHSSPG